MLGKRDSAGLEASTSGEFTTSSSMKRERLVVADDDSDEEAVLNVVDDDDDEVEEVSSELNRTSRRLANAMNVSGASDQPLDLSVKKDKLPSGCLPAMPQPRPSVIRNGFVEGGKKTSPSHFLVSTVLAEQPDVTEHFRRSLSGKWPHESQSPSPPSSARSSSSQRVIVTTGAIEIEEHFRKALGPEAYEQWRKLKSQDLAS